MSVVGLLVIGAATGTLSLLVRSRPRWSTAIALAGLAGMAAAAAGIDGSSIDIGGMQLAGPPWLRLFALLGAVVGWFLVFVDAAGLGTRDAPAVFVLGLSGSVLALAAVDPGVAVVAASAGALAGILVARRGRSGRGVPPPAVGTTELRALAVAGTLAIVATAWLARPLGGLVASPALFGGAYLAFALAVAIRFGAIPFHLWAGRIADGAPGVAMPLLLAWGPAAFAAVALVWIDRSVAPLVLPLPAERGLVGAIGVLSVVFGLLAAWVQDDLDHVVGYLLVADAGFVVLGLAVLDPAIWQPAHVWLLIYVVVRSALAGWAVAIRGAFGTSRITDLNGWARRTPLLAVGLAVVGVASVGWPGLAIWDARATIAELALPQPLATLIGAAPLAGIAIVARLLIVGVARPSPVVRQARGERPTRPTLGERGQSPAGGRVSGRVPGVGAFGQGLQRFESRMGPLTDAVRAIPAAFRLNRVPIASLAVLVLAGLAAAVSTGGLGISGAAGVLPPPTEAVAAPSTAPVPLDGQSSGASTQRSMSRL